MRASSAALFALLAAAACSRRTTVVDGGAPSPSTTATSLATPSVVNLLHHSDAHVTLSSRVDNPRDFPEHLVDGKPGTAWNGKTGDRNAWIEVALDPRVTVKAIEVTAGFDKGALFEKNLRIRKLRIERDGTRIRDVLLDTSERGLQRFELDTPGGTFKLTVLDTAPGTEPRWTEIVVSELRVLGTAPPPVFRAEASLPKMSVAPGSAPPPLPASLSQVRFEGREGTSLDAICRAFRSELLAVVKREQKAGRGLADYDPAEVKCEPTSAPPFEGELPLGWSLAPTVSAARLAYFDGLVQHEDFYLVLKRPDGATIAGPMYSTSSDVGDAPSPGYWRAGMGLSKGQPVLLTAYAAVWHSPYDNREMDALNVEHAGRVCRFERTRFTCDQPHPTVFLLEKLDGAQGAAFKAAPRAKLPPIDPATGTLKPWTQPP